MATRSIDVTVTLDHAKISRMLADTSDASAWRAAGRVRDRAKAKATVDTGRMQKSITARKLKGGPGQPLTEYSVGSDLFYTPFQELGTGPIYPVRAKVLRFKPKGSSVYIFRPRTRGVPAVHFLRDARLSLTFSDFMP